MASEEGGCGGCGCAIVLVLFIIAGVKYEIENGFEGGVWAWIIMGVLVIVAVLMVLGGIVGSIFDKFR